MKCTDRLDKLMSHLTSNESNFIRETLETKSIPTPTLLIKDHKPLEEDGNFPRRIIILATNFTAGFPKVGYQGIQKILTSNNINFARFTIVQSSHLQKELLELHPSKEGTTFISFDAVNMYPSVKFHKNYAT